MDGKRSTVAAIPEKLVNKWKSINYLSHPHLLQMECGTNSHVEML